jgi:hypothetical protein
MTTHAPTAGPPLRPPPRRAVTGALTHLFLAPAPKALASITGSGPPALLAVHAALVALPATLVTLSLATTPLADPPNRAQRRG